MVVEQTWHPNPLPIRGQSWLADFRRLSGGHLGWLQVREWSAEPDFAPMSAEATMKFSMFTSFDHVREYGIMKIVNPQETTCMERQARCAR